MGAYSILGRMASGVSTRVSFIPIAKSRKHDKSEREKDSVVTAEGLEVLIQGLAILAHRGQR